MHLTIQKYGQNFEVITDTERAKVRTVIPDDFPEFAAVIQETPCGRQLVTFIDSEEGYHVRDSEFLSTLDDAVSAALRGLLELGGK